MGGVLKLKKMSFWSDLGNTYLNAINNAIQLPTNIIGGVFGLANNAVGSVGTAINNPAIMGSVSGAAASILSPVGSALSFNSQGTSVQKVDQQSSNMNLLLIGGLLFLIYKFFK